MHYLEDCTVLYAWVTWNEGGDAERVCGPEVLTRPAFRAARVADDSEQLLYLYFPSKSTGSQRKLLLRQIVKIGLKIHGIT